ncbi:hypothetical protein [Mandarin fish ranavirus]|nr:hypothetical protein [Mandarin fish ranavirus]
MSPLRLTVSMRALALSDLVAFSSQMASASQGLITSNLNKSCSICSMTESVAFWIKVTRPVNKCCWPIMVAG